MKVFAITLVLTSWLMHPAAGFEEVAVKYSGSDATFLQQLNATIVLDRRGNPELRRICAELDIEYWRIYNVFTLKEPAIGPTERVLIGEDGAARSIMFLGHAQRQRSGC